MSQEMLLRVVRRVSAPLASDRARKRVYRASMPYLRALVALLAVLSIGSVRAATGGAGEVIFAKGVTTAQAAGGGPVRFLGRGAPLEPGDVISTASRSFAVLRLADNTKITLRPSTVFAVEAFEITSPPTEERSPTGQIRQTGSGRAVLRLFQGGLRAVTGFISKRNPDALVLRTQVATIGIRGTQFEARICGDDCEKEASAQRKPPPGSTTPVVGRVVKMRGKVEAQGEFADPRPLNLGGALYSGDVISTGTAAYAVIEYRDGARISLGRNSSFRIDGHRFTPKTPARNRSVFTFLRGGLRVLTGLVGRKQRSQFALRTAVATIGIRGTGFDVGCIGSCEQTAQAARLDAPSPTPASEALCSPQSGAAGNGEGLSASVWEGEIGVAAADCTAPVKTGQHLLVAGPREKPKQLANASPIIANLQAPRPDGPDAVDPSMRDPFAAVEQDAPSPGLYVTVFEGDVSVQSADGGRVDLGADETGFVGGGAGGGGGLSVVRVTDRPNFSEVPDPRVFEDPDIQDIFQLFDDPGSRPQNRFECVL